jgi:hypothetical protein
MIENVFTLTVKSAFFKTEVWASVTAVLGALLIGAGISVVLLKKKGAKA